MRPLRRRWPVIGLVALTAALGAVLARPPQAGAHAVLERSLPVQSEQLAEPPELVETWYSEPLERSLTTLTVVDTEGSAVHVGETLFSNEDATYAAIALPEDLAPGIYTVTYENVSQVDGHVWSGFFSFIVLNADGTVPEGEALVPGGLAGQVGLLPANADNVLRWVGLIATVVLAGGFIFAFFVARPAAEFLDDERFRRVDGAVLPVLAATVLPAALAIALSTLGQLFLLAERLGDLGQIGRIAFETRSGQLWLSRATLALALSLLLLPALGSDGFRRSRQAMLTVLPGLIGGLGLMMTYSLGSHGAAGGGAFWAVAGDFVHFAATAAWLGALLQLGLAFWWTSRVLDGPRRLLYLANALDRFSWLAVVSVALIIGTGTFNGFVQLPTLESLWDTTYGRVLIAKLALILPLLGVAAINALFLKPALVEAIDELHGEGPSERAKGGERDRLNRRSARLQRLLPRTTAAEFVLGIAVLASVSVLSQSTTAAGELRLQAAEPTGQFVASEEADSLTTELTIEPFGLGVNTYTLRLTPSPGEELNEVLGARLVATFDDPEVSPSAGRSGTDLELQATNDPAVWRSEAALLTQPGDWRLQARVRQRGLDDTIVSFSVSNVGGFLAREDEPRSLFDLPFTYVGWDIVAGGAMVALGIGAFLIWRNRPPSWQRGVATSVGLSSIVGLVAGTILVFGVHTHQGPMRSTNPIEMSPESVAIGEQIFMNNCVTCHGPTGEGDGPLANSLEFPPPRLGDHVPFHNDGTLFRWITEGIPVDEEPKHMPSFRSQLSDDERWHLVNYLRATWSTGSFEPVLPEDLTTR